MSLNISKIVIVINGAGGVGKDTLCEIAAEKYSVKNISSITPIKEIGRLCGWQGEKTDKARKFLADLKMVCVEYNDYPTRWAKEEYDKFLLSDEEIMFVHIREPEAIKKFVDATAGEAKTLLIRGGERTKRERYGNAADDCVENYSYDYYFDNDKGLDEAKENFLDFLSTVIA